MYICVMFHGKTHEGGIILSNSLLLNLNETKKNYYQTIYSAMNP